MKKVIGIRQSTMKDRRLLVIVKEERMKVGHLTLQGDNLLKA